MQSQSYIIHFVSIVMMESASHEKVGLLASWWVRLTAMPNMIACKVSKIAKNTKKLGQDDPRRVFHSLKVGFALTLVSLFYYYQPLYDNFGVSAMWAVMTVVVVFEFSVGMLVISLKLYLTNVKLIISHRHRFLDDIS